MKKYYSLVLLTAIFCQYVFGEEYFDFNGYSYQTTSDTTVMCRGHNSSGGLVIVTIPSCVSNKGKTYKVTSVRESAFYFDHDVTTINLPSTIDSIYDEAFAGSSKIENVVFPNSIVYVGNRVFPYAKCEIKNAHCMAKLPTSYVGEYTVPEGISQIAGNAFEDCKQLTKISLPNSLKIVGEEAFAGCAGLDTLIIPDSVTYIGDMALHANNYLYIGESVEKIEDDYLALKVHTLYWNAKCCHDIFKTFANYRGWSLIADTVIIGNSVKKIPDYFCYKATGVKNIIVKEGCEEIGQYAFLECDSLVELIFPESLRYINVGAFISCKNVGKIQFNEGLIEIGDHTFQGCSSIDSITFPNSVSKIGPFAFGSCANLSSLILPNRIDCVDSSAFISCPKLQSLTLPASVKRIEASAFAGCWGLSNITSYAIEPPICGTYVFVGVNRQIPLYVPKGSKEKYAQAYIWKEFINTSEVETALNDIECPNFSEKIIKNGQIFILRGDKTYTLQGQEIK